ncbi:unnamed protein product [Darwinula stevensoni]|uniref:Uncharacterized protein n=1 Tax=Darwinula stevensoni TaxID=69355 RepID=A0A7R8XDN2_9CRUS|nr:unnamed protein product [Darwinula stevensoni]CAG0894953.1 unnamed protein product [Darwinula stevensoni]
MGNYGSTTVTKSKLFFGINTNSPGSGSAARSWGPGASVARSLPLVWSHSTVVDAPKASTESGGEVERRDVFHVGDQLFLPGLRSSRVVADCFDPYSAGPRSSLLLDHDGSAPFRAEVKPDSMQGIKNIEVVDGRDVGLDEDLAALKKYLPKKVKGGHVLLDEVPITLGFQGTITSEALSEHWKWIVDMNSLVKSITVSFRPNDQSFLRDIPLQDVRPGGYKIRILESVMRNSRKIAELFLAILDYSRRIFISSEKTLPLDIKQSGNGFLPVLFPIPSCFSIHPGECKDEKTYEAVRCSFAVQSIYEEYSKSSEKIPLFVVVDHQERRNALVNVFTFLYPSIPLLFLNFNWSRHVWDFHGNVVSEVLLPIVVVTESEMIGCHLTNVTVVIDIAQSKWQNYARLIATTGDRRKIIVVEEEQLRIGKFSRVRKEISGWETWEIMKSVDKNLKVRLEKAMKQCHVKKIDYLEEDTFPPAPFPGMSIDWNGREGEERDVNLMLRSWLSGIFGPPASGKSRRVDVLISRVTERGDRVLLLHSESVLSRIAFRQRWEGKDNVDFEGFDSNKINSLQDIINRVQRIQREEKRKEKHFMGRTILKAKISKEEEREKREKKKQRREEGEARTEKGFGKKQEMGLLNVVVEDCPLLKDFKLIIEKLKEMKIRLILAFKPHSEDAEGEAVERYIKVLQDNPESTAIVLRSQPTNVHLLKHIQKNETGKALQLKAGNLSVSSVPAAIVLGPAVRWFKCSGQHLGYICKGMSSCSKAVALASSLSHRVLPRQLSGYSSEILVSSEELLTSLQTLKTHLDIHDVKVIHPKDFRGSEASVVITVDVGDDWLLEAISRSRNQLFIIDNIPSHEDLWKTMMEEQRVQTWDDPIPWDNEAYSRIFLTLDEEEQFLNFQHSLCFFWRNEDNAEQDRQGVAQGINPQERIAVAEMCPPKGDYVQKTKHEIIKLSDGGMKACEIAAKTNLDQRNVRTIIKDKERLLSEVKSARPMNYTIIRKRHGLVAEMEPTWKDAGQRIGVTALKRGLLDQDTGNVLSLSQMIWKALDGVLPLPHFSSPFTDWGYATRLSYSGAQHSLPLAVQRSGRPYAPYVHVLAIYHRF